MIPNNKYFIRKSFEDKASQKGVYNALRAVKNAFLKLSEADQKEYKVFDVLGNTIYPSKNIIKKANGEPINNPLEMKYPINKDVADDKVIWDYFKSKGLNDYGIAGLMGNLYAESGLKPCNLQNSFNTSLDMTDEEYTIRVDNGNYINFIKDGAGYGLAQWTFWSLKQDLLNYCQEKKKSISDLQTQLDFLTQQL